MRKAQRYLIVLLTLLLAFFAGSTSGRSRAELANVEAPPVAYAWGQQLTVYYPGQKKIYVYSELGGNCVYAYTLSTPGGPIARENCR